MKQKPYFCILAHRRPQALQNCLENITKINNIENWNVLIYFDGGFDEDNIDIINNYTPKLNLKAKYSDTNDKAFIAFKKMINIAYHHTSMVLTGEEDCIFAKDICNLTEYFYNKYPYKFGAISHRSWVSYDIPKELNNLYYPVVETPHLSYSLTRNTYRKLIRYIRDYKEELFSGKDDNMNKFWAIYKIEIIRPLLTRVKHCYNGIHVDEENQKSFYDKVTFIEDIDEKKIIIEQPAFDLSRRLYTK